MLDTGSSPEIALGKYTNALPPATPPTWRVRVMHRETGALLRLGGVPLTLLGKDRTALEDTALQHRDRDVWQAVATPLTASTAEAG